MKAPTRRNWPRELRRIASERHLYKELVLLRFLAPVIMIWLIEHWQTDQGARALDILAVEGALSLALKAERGEFQIDSKSA